MVNNVQLEGQLAVTARTGVNLRVYGSLLIETAKATQILILS